MNIVVNVAGLLPEVVENLRDAARTVVEEATHSIGVDVNEVLVVHIVDEASFGQALQELQGNSAHTNNDLHVAMGKAVPQFSSNGYIGSALVLRCEVLLGFFDLGIPIPEELASTLKYLLFHELGHFIDHRKRPNQFSLPSTETYKSNLQRCELAGTEAVLSEYAASFHSAKFMTQSGFESVLTGTRKSEQDMRIALTKLRGQYLEGAVTLSELNSRALDVFWRILMEHSKLLALVAGNPALAPKKDSLHLISAGGQKVLPGYAADLQQIWQNYPSADHEFYALIAASWHELALNDGYFFEARADGDCLWLK